ncbi:MAG: glycosyltransferase [Clostridia bacterium]|nr:glycosyltransferase [Clostridia bacterium]
MKIGVLKESLCIGGTERSAANISVALSKKHDITTILFNGSEIVYPYGGKLVDMNLPSQMNYLKKIVTAIKRRVGLSKLVKQDKYDVVFLFAWQKNPINTLRLKKCVKIISIRDFGALAEKPEVYKKNLDTSDGVICNSQYIRDYYVEKYPEDADKAFAVHNIIDTQSIILQSKEALDDEGFVNFRSSHKKVIVAVGRFCKEKAFENLILAIKECKSKMSDIGLVFVGDGELKDSCAELVKQAGLEDNVYFAGYQKNPYKYMHKCDAFVLSSRSEGFPNVLAEAMALSLPVISTNCLTGPAEILMKNHDYNVAKDKFEECDYGIITPRYDSCGEERAISQLSEAIFYLLSDEELMKKYSRLAGERTADFSAEAAVEKLEEIFILLKKRREKNNARL